MGKFKQNYERCFENFDYKTSFEQHHEKNHIKNYNNPRQFPSQRGPSATGIQQGPMTTYPRQYVPQPQAGQVPHSRQMPQMPITGGPIHYNMGVLPQHQAGGQVFVSGATVFGNVPPGAAVFGNVPQSPHFVKVDQFRPSPAQYLYYDQSVPPNGQALSYTTPVSQAMPQSVAMTTLGMQPQLQAQIPNQQVQPPAASVQQATPPVRTERPRKGIRICDPNQGGKDITEEILKKKNPAPQPEPQVQPVPSTVRVSGDEKIKAEFAAKVAAAKDGNAALSQTADKPKTEHVEHVAKADTKITERSTIEDLTSVQENIKTDLNVEKSQPENPGLSGSITDVGSKANEEMFAAEQPLPPKDQEEHIEKNDQQTVVDEVLIDDGFVEEEMSTVNESTENESTSTTQIEKNDSVVESVGVQLLEKVEAKEEPVSNAAVPVDNETNSESQSTQDFQDNNDITDGKEIEETNKEPELSTDTNKLPETEVKTELAASEEQKVSLKNTETEEQSDVSPPLANGFDKPAVMAGQASIQASKKKKKKEYKDKDTDLMSAFTDKPDEEINAEPSSKDAEQTEETDEAVVKEETWEDKEIKTEEEVPKADKRICYDRDFLLGFQYSKEMPKDLPNFELVLREAHEPTKPLESGRIPSNDFFMPKYMRQGSGGRQAGMNRSGKGGRAAPPKKIIPTNFDNKVELKKSENAWVRPSEKVKDLNAEESEKEELYRKARGILNKLTPQNFEKLVEQMKALVIDTSEKLKTVIDIIFEKALLEPGFSSAYAKLCMELSSKKIESSENGKGSHLTFRRILLNKCQAEFEKEKTDEQQLEKEQAKHYENADEEKAWQEEIAYKKRLTKKRSLGNIRFIGELFKLKMLTEAIMHTCITKLLKDRDEESLECFSQLITTIGKDIDHEKAKPRTDQYFHQVDKIINQRKVSSRIIFMLQDVKDLRDGRWVSRRMSEAPKTIAEIHEEAKQEEIQMQMAHQQAAQKRMMNKGGGGGRDSPAQSRVTSSEEGWNQVQSKGGRTMQTVDPSRLKITKRADSENISLGPYGRAGSWAQGASGGGSSRFGLPAEGGESRQGNRFSALSGGESGGHRQDSKGRSSQRGMQPSRFGRSSGSSSGRRAPQQPQQQMTDERAAALASVRRICVDETRTPSPSNTQAKSEEVDREVSGARTPEAPEDTVAEPSDSPPVSDIPDSKVQKETKMTIDEYLITHDKKEADSCIRDLNCASKHNIVVSEAINIAIEKKLEQVKVIGDLLHSFLKSGLISSESFKKGLSEVLEFAEDIAVDIPHIWTNLGYILGPAVEDEKLPLSELKTLVEPLIQCNKAGLLMAEILAAAAKISSESAICSLWQKSDLSWKSLLREGSDLQNFILQHKMGFTMTSASQKQTLSDILEDPSCTCQSAMDWIEKNVSSGQHSDIKFIRELSTGVYKRAVSKECELNSTQIKSFKNLLLKYIDNDKTKELQALFAAQLLSEELKHPKGFLRALFESLYDEEIISEDSVTAWEVSNEEPVGKGNALNSVQGFLEWLKTSEEESHEENK